MALQIVWPFFFPSACQALEANELLVVANRNDRESVALAQYYMRKRGVPGKNLLKISVTDNETCSRADYDRLIARPIREKLEKYSLAQRLRCVVTVRGVPLRISEIPLTEAEQAEIAGLKAERELLNGKVKGVLDEGARKKASEALSAVEKKIVSFESKQNTGASVDSELMLVLANEYPLSMWVANPFFMGFKGEKLKLSKNEVVMVSRLDAPTPQIVRRIIDDAIAAEKDGLTGTACFDARYKDPGTITTKGQITIPKEVRDTLSLTAGDKVEFVLIDKREALIRPVSKKVDDVFGLLHKPGRKAVSVEQMTEGIRRKMREDF